MTDSNMKIALFGPQGSGKGTQADRLSEHFGIPHIAPGDIFRKAIADGTELGHKVEEIINAGNLVPNEVTNALMKERIEQEDCVDGFIFDGYPRNANQADAMDSITAITHAIVIDIPEEESIKRISRRRVAPQSGRVYHLDYNPPKVEGICDESGEPLIQRDDDKPEAIQQRLAIYHAETEPVLSRYEERGIVYRIDGKESIEKVWQAVLSIFE